MKLIVVGVIALSSVSFSTWAFWSALGASQPPPGQPNKPAIVSQHELSLPTPGTNLSIPWGGAAYWSFTLSASGEITGNGTAVENGSAMSVQVFNNSSFAHYLAGGPDFPNFMAYPLWNVTGPLNGAFEFRFALPPGEWNLVIINAYPADACRYGCPTILPPTIVRWNAGISVETTGSIVLQ